MIELDGSQGEGGGQVLRTALTLAMITGTPFRIERIRARRSKPGLLRQHLTAVNAAAEICGASVQGAELGSLKLAFTPGAIRGGDYRFAIGTAGSCTLVLQTVLPALWFADGPSSVWVSGGTHNPMAPPADFLIQAWLPLMRRMGVDMDITLLRHGFYPAGGGEVSARVSPLVAGALLPLHLDARGERSLLEAEAIVAGVPGSVARRELERLAATLGPIDGRVRELPPREGPGNALLVHVSHGDLREMFTAFGERGVAAEAVADAVALQVRAYLASDAAVGEYLADQLVMPMALAGAGSLTASTLSSHLTTNIAMLEKFLPVSWQVEERAGGSVALRLM